MFFLIELTIPWEKRYTVKPSLRKKVGLISEVPRINIEMILEIGENKVWNALTVAEFIFYGIARTAQKSMWLRADAENS